MKPFSKSLSLSLMAVVLTIGANSSGCAYSPREPKSEVDLISPAIDRRSDDHLLIVNQGLVDSIYYESDEVTIYVPARPIVDALGLTYVWDEEAKSGTIQHEEFITTITIGSQIAHRNGYPILYGAPRLIKGEVWLDSLAISRILDVDYANWDQSQQEYRIYRFPEPDQNLTDLEKAAIEEVKQHLKKQQFDLLAPHLESVQSLKNINISSAQQLASVDTTNDGVVKVVVDFLKDYQGINKCQFNQSCPTRYEHSYLIRFNDDQVTLSLISERANRTDLGYPIPFLNESDFVRISEIWRRNNFYSLLELLGVADETVKAVDLQPLSLLTRVDEQNSFNLTEKEREKIFDYFSESVRNSPGWSEFRGLEKPRDPTFWVLFTTSKKDFISAEIIGNWTVDGFNMTPILLDIDLSWEERKWKITRMENVRLYENVDELAKQEPMLYTKIAEQYVFRRVTRIAPFYL